MLALFNCKKDYDYCKHCLNVSKPAKMFRFKKPTQTNSLTKKIIMYLLDESNRFLD